MTLDLADGNPAGSLVGDELLVAMLSRLTSGPHADDLGSAGPAFSRALRVRLADFLQAHHAARPLEESDLALAEAALRAGFSDQGQFSRVFKRAAGCTPSVYRRLKRL